MDVQHPSLPPELRPRILSFLPPNGLALGGRLTCKDAAARFSQPHHRTVHLNQQLPPYAVASLEASLRTWPLRHALWLLVGSPRCGREEGVEAVWRAVQPRLFPELLHTDHYLKAMYRDPASPGDRVIPKDDIGSAAVAGGLAHLLPSLAQRCPGLIDPGRTLEAAARHCDLAGLQAAWGLLWDRLQEEEVDVPQEGFLIDLGSPMSYADDTWSTKLRGTCQRMMAAAAASSTPDATAKMEWLRGKVNSICRGFEVHDHAIVWGAAAASGDLARMQWLLQHGFKADPVMSFWQVLRHADLSFIQRLEMEDGLVVNGGAGEGRYLPPVGHVAWRVKAYLCGAAASAKDSAAKLRWLAGRGVELDSPADVLAAASHGNLEALQLLLPAGRTQPPAGAGQDRGFQAALGDALDAAVEAGRIATASWLIQAMGCELQSEHDKTSQLQPKHYRVAFQRGNLPTVRWLLQAGCPRDDLTLCDALRTWPSISPGDSEALAEAVRMLAAAGWPNRRANGQHPLTAAARHGHSWAVWIALVQLLPPGDAPTNLPHLALSGTARAGCGAMLEALVGMGRPRPDNGASGNSLAAACYTAAAKNGDLGTLDCLRRLGVPLGAGVLGVAVREGSPLCALKWLVRQGAVLGVSGASILDDLREGRCYKDCCTRQEVQEWVQGLVGGEASAGQQGERATAGQRGVAAGGSGSGGRSSAGAGRPGARSTGRVRTAAPGLNSVLMLPVAAVKRAAMVLGGLASRLVRQCRGAA